MSLLFWRACEKTKCTTLYIIKYGCIVNVHVASIIICYVTLCYGQGYCMTHTRLLVREKWLSFVYAREGEREIEKTEQKRRTVVAAKCKCLTELCDFRRALTINIASIKYSEFD